MTTLGFPFATAITQTYLKLTIEVVLSCPHVSDTFDSKDWRLK